MGKQCLSSISSPNDPKTKTETLPVAEKREVQRKSNYRKPQLKHHEETLRDKYPQNNKNHSNAQIKKTQKVDQPRQYNLIAGRKKQTKMYQIKQKKPLVSE